ncbi:adenosylcobalamin-dependent ribonucleoside-diphosphate reductase [candidate division WWE3 bacterium]|nr:adenosylcobalamin-dependent ribonucleoside-diphosphate reductase [candidate division WWE3 bacterium]
MKWLEPADDSSVLKSGDNASSALSNYPEKNKKIELSDNARTILEKRYLRKNSDGTPCETIEGMFDRIASAIAQADSGYRDVELSKIEFYNLLTTRKFFPNSPTFTGAGTPLGQLAACFVLPIDDDMGRGKDGIFSTLRNAALIQQTGGGNGFSFSDLRPKGSYVSRSGGKATGPVGFLEVYDAAFGVIAQGGVRRGANMAVLRVDHPDVRDFIKCKSSEGHVANFNISIAITDVFMRAVEDDTTYELIDPHTKQITETPRAREIYDMIVKYAHKNGEPGVLFVDAANRSNPVPHLYDLKATNPCGEQWLGPYENCCLGSINLAEHVTKGGKFDWEEFRRSIVLSTRFLDNVVTANGFVPEVPQLREAADNSRRIGLGFMGLSDVMYKVGIRYGSEIGQEFSAQVAEFMRYHSMKTSIELAKERGTYKAFKGSMYDPENFTFTPPVPLRPYRRDFERPSLDWNEIVSDIKTYGIRNAAQTTIAPTGTISTVAGIEGYGCEPVFALAYYRNVYQAAMDENGLTLTYVSPTFLQALDKAGIIGDERKAIVDEIVNTGTCQQIKGIPDELKNTFVVSADITPEEHIMMQASIQAFIDNSISKTCNFPAGATPEDVSKVYKMGWELGCKGLTVYVTGSRDEVVLETKATKDAKISDASVASEKLVTPRTSSEPSVTRGSSTDREYKLMGATYKVATPQGKAYITLNRDIDGNPVELFMNVGKAGSDVAALSEALGRALSGWLQASVNPLNTVREIVSQFVGIGGSRSVGFGQNKVTSIPDALAKVFTEEFNLRVHINGTTKVESPENQIAKETPKYSSFAIADMCPDCGNHTLVKEEGCQKCYGCGFSLC